MSDRNYQRLMFGIAFAVLFARCAAGPRVKPAPLPIRGNTPHLEAKTETHVPDLDQIFFVQADVVGSFGKGNMICVTPEWLVTSVGVPLIAQRQCGQEMTFFHPYQFRRRGEQEIVVTLRYNSGAVFGRKSIKVYVGGRNEVSR